MKSFKEILIFGATLLVGGCAWTFGTECGRTAYKNSQRKYMNEKTGKNSKKESK